MCSEGMHSFFSFILRNLFYPDFSLLGFEDVYTDATGIKA